MTSVTIRDLVYRTLLAYGGSAYVGDIAYDIGDTNEKVHAVLLELEEEGSVSRRPETTGGRPGDVLFRVGRGI